MAHEQKDRMDERAETTANLWAAIFSADNAEAAMKILAVGLIEAEQSGAELAAEVRVPYTGNNPYEEAMWNEAQAEMSKEILMTMMDGMAKTIVLVMDAMDRLQAHGLIGRKSREWTMTPDGEITAARLKASGYQPQVENIRVAVERLAGPMSKEDLPKLTELVIATIGSTS